LKTKEEIFDFVQKLKDRDNERNVHIGDRMVVVVTDNEGFQLMHEKDYFRERGKVYKVELKEIY
jgi:hypothetical protein